MSAFWPRARSEAARWRTWLLWLALLALVTAAMLPLRPILSDAHVALAYLLLVLFAGARAGQAIALTTACFAFLSFDWFFLPPFGTLALANPLHWFVLVAFLVASVVATRLFDRSRNEAALLESVRARDALIASLSHDLRTPLTTIKALAHDLSSGGDDRALTIEEEADRLHALVADLLDLSRVNSGTVQLTIEPNEAEDLLGAALQRVSGQSNGREISVRLDENHPLLFGRFDFAQSLRILVNLLDNALKYSPPDTPIEIAVRRDGASLCFVVADRGRGVPHSQRGRIFEPFYRPPGVQADTHGAGLGLSISRALAQAQTGSLTVEARDGGGSLFTLRLPAIDVTDTTESEEAQSSSDTGPQPFTKSSRTTTNTSRRP